MDGHGGPVRRPCVLVADDDYGIRNLMVALFDFFGVEAIVTRDGREAAALFRRHRAEIDLVLLELELPGQSGLATLDAIRRIAPDVPCWFVTGDVIDCHPEELIERGATGVILKPFKLE